MPYELSETTVEPVVTIPLSEYRDLVSKATRFEILKSEIEESVYSGEWERRICNISKKCYDSIDRDKIEDEGEN